MAESVKLNFNLRTTANVKTVHLVGTWDGYKGQLPLSKDKESGKGGAWKGTFKFQGAALQPGERYWYYYIIDGYHVSHDPARPFTTEPTTGRKLNILSIPAKGAAPSQATSRQEKRSSKNIAHGRSLSPDRIAHPAPQRPAATKHFRSQSGVAELTRKFADSNLDSDSDDSGSEFEEDSSDADSDCPSLSSRGSSVCSSPLRSPTESSRSSSRSSTSSTCSCERFGITRKGTRVRLDCGGKRCGGDVSDCSSGAEDDVEEYKVRDTRRNGVVVRSVRR